MNIRGTTITTPIARAAMVDDRTVSGIAWSSKNTVDKLCPAFTESGAIVSCEPVEGYPLTVTADTEATTITRCGRNLLDMTAVELVTYTWADGTASAPYWGVKLQLPAGTYTLKAAAVSSATKEGYVYGVVNDAQGNWLRYWTPVYGGTMTALPATFTEPVTVYIYAAAWPDPVSTGIPRTHAASHFALFNIQLEVGSAATAFEPYNGGTFTPGDAIPALAGANIIYADAGEVTVTGKADPTAIIEKLTNAIIALGGNI